MKYSEEELNIINEKRPDLRRKPDPSTNDAIIEFLRKYDLDSQLSKNLTSQEWLSFKQQVKGHKDFSKFQTNYFNEVIKFNQNIDKKLEDPQTQKELDFLKKKYSISERIRHYRNPLYSKYQLNYKIRKKIKLLKIGKSFWIWLIFVLSIVLIIFVF